MEMQNKRCSKCKKLKNITEFYKDNSRKDRHLYICIDCIKKRKRNYYLANPQKYIDDTLKRQKANPEKVRKRVIKWQKDNPQKLKNIYYKFYQKKRENISYRLNHRIGTLIYRALKEKKNSSRWEDAVGYTLQDLIIHLEKLFKPGMSWKNYGKWHIDHIKPRTYFNFNSYEDKEFKECWALSNLQPLWASENISKSRKINQ